MPATSRTTLVANISITNPCFGIAVDDPTNSGQNVLDIGGKGALTAKQRAIKVGPIAGDNYPVLDGIKAGESVVVSGSQKLADRAPITPAK